MAQHTKLWTKDDGGLQMGFAKMNDGMLHVYMNHLSMWYTAYRQDDGAFDVCKYNDREYKKDDGTTGQSRDLVGKAHVLDDGRMKVMFNYMPDVWYYGKLTAPPQERPQEQPQERQQAPAW